MAPYSPLPPNAKPRPILHVVRPYQQIFGQTVPSSSSSSISSSANTVLNTNANSTSTTYRRPAHERALLERSRWMLSLAVCCMLMVGWMVASPETAHLDRVDDMEHSRHIVQPGMFRHIHKLVSRGRDIPLSLEAQPESELLWRSTEHDLKFLSPSTTLESTKSTMARPQPIMTASTTTTLSRILIPKRAQHTTSAVFSDVAQADEPSTENTSGVDSQDDQSTASQSSPSPSSSANQDMDMAVNMGQSLMPVSPSSSSSPAPQGRSVRRGKVDKRRSRTGGQVGGERWVWVEKGVLEVD
ncbi:hypothetical protein BCR39DRAFT_507487 [Naematelia encephala]|uniref:Uncharacterized protein n=1 Tax=Naematelia encephala TaxID=71784 RepID=A0A1Y2APA2_9TREE|nr:hypothetical protein BCR39DRAFT_507487 [Naematelia encephala]